MDEYTAGEGAGLSRGVSEEGEGGGKGGWVESTGVETFSRIISTFEKRRHMRMEITKGAATLEGSLFTTV